MHLQKRLDPYQEKKRKNEEEPERKRKEIKEMNTTVKSCHANLPFYFSLTFFFFFFFFFFFTGKVSKVQDWFSLHIFHSPLVLALFM